MLEPEGRLLLLAALRPPAGFALDRAIGTTYTLDLAALLTAPVGFALLDRESADGRSVIDPVALLEAVRRNAERIDIFCQAGAIGLPAAYQPIVSYVEDSIHEVLAPTPGHIFHPKVWVIRYAYQGGADARWRLLVLSRNLTFDRSWDTILRLDGSPRSSPIGDNEPLVRFVRALPRLMRGRPEKRLLDTVTSFADGLANVWFDRPADFDAVLFHPMGLDPGATSWPFPPARRVDRSLVVSPFLTDGCLQRLAGGRADADVLISRPESLDRVGGAAVQHLRETLVLSGDTEPATTAEEGDTDESAIGAATTELAAEAPGHELRGLHAKAFVTEHGHRTHVWTGSANATDAAFGGNVEFLVELRGYTERIGIDRMLAGSPGSLTLRSLLESWRPASQEPTEPTEEERLQRRLDAGRLELARYDFEARLESLPDDRFGMRLIGKRPTDGGDGQFEGIRVTCRPLTLAGHDVEVEVRDGSVDIDFGTRSFEAITSFFAFELTASTASDLSVSFLVNARLVGAPADRRERTLVGLLRNRGDLLRFLLFLLGGADGGSAEMLDLGPKLINALAGPEEGPSGGLDWQNLFEPMVRALAHDPRKLDDIHRLIRDLERTEAGRELLPDGWASVWEPILASRQALEPAT